ncbi:hypothetical protein N7495_004661 [Penicillium taxi]|uniref:uncharacterized protein n=1 Tax=Penicillium taxi TaxID=168475 RepID=UPI0025459698|nr:uncharacterized protein N7495_004661 [Penicillium taxi]KAJ5899917.1 hypothetical protein N7495_004661 [Penicillium taxi]
MHVQGRWSICTCLLLLAQIFQVHAINLNIDDQQSFKDAASDATYGMMKWYSGNETGAIPGAFPSKWWEGAALFLALLNYWHFTGDDTYNDELKVGLQWQSGTEGDYMPSNYSSYLGNDDQMFWGLAAMTAAELKLPNMPTGFSWLSLAQGVFNTQKDRWETSMCDGGLRWQLYVYQGSGYYLKNAVSNGGFFQLAARLARYTNDDQYLKWARKAWDWSCSVPLVNNKTWEVSDSTNGENQCNNGDHTQWTYNYGIYMMGAAYMYSHTNESSWLDAVNGLLNTTLDKFFDNKIMSEVTCEPSEKCNSNEILFKGLESSWLAFTALLIPSTSARILPYLQSSAAGAAASCTGNNNNTCGVRWLQSKWDGWTGMEEQISASNLFSANMLRWVNDSNYSPVTASTGGNSSGDVNAGMGDTQDTVKPMTTGQKAGGGILTVIFFFASVGMGSFLIMGG